MNNKIENLNQAKANKKDEFYTQYEDIEKEMAYYKDQFKDKTIYCNCDYYKESQFFKYFYNNFYKLKLKRLIATYYENKTGTLFKTACHKEIEYADVTRKNYKDGYVKKLKGDGDFKSQECYELLAQSDIVVTNPPFSKFREFIFFLIKQNKNFIILGNLTAIFNKGLTQRIVSGDLQLGESITSGDREFKVPHDYPVTTNNSRIDSEGKKYVRVKGVRWFSNIKYRKRYEILSLSKKYYGNESQYPEYDNYKIINVNKTKEIPHDYKGVMGVPISYIDKHNPNQFEILGTSRSLSNEEKSQFIKTGHKDYKNVYLKNKRVFSRLFIKRKIHKVVV